MWCAFLVFSFLINDSSTTANIADSFISPVAMEQKFDVVFSLDQNKSLSLQSLKDIQWGTWKSLRISLLYNDSLKDIITSSVISSYNFSLLYNDNSLIILIDLNNQSIESWKEIFTIPLKNIDNKDMPIIDSVILFDIDEMNALSIKNISSNILNSH